MSRCLALGLTGLVMLLLSPTASLAEGGQSIAAAPAVVFGQQEFGSLSHGAEVGSEHCIPVYRSWWTLPVMAGDAVTIDWEAQDRYARLNLFASGTTDFTYPQTSPVIRSELNANSKAELTYSASQTGSLPLEIEGGSDSSCNAGLGPYAFIASVKHTVRLFIPHRATLPRQGTVPVSVHTAEGGMISDPGLQIDLQLGSHGHWQTIGHAGVTNSIAAVPVRLPARLRGRRFSLRATAHGSNYTAATSGSVPVRVG